MADSRAVLERFEGWAILVMVYTVAAAGIMLVISKPFGVDWTNPIAIGLRFGALGLIVLNVLLNLVGWFWEWRLQRE